MPLPVPFRPACAFLSFALLPAALAGAPDEAVAVFTERFNGYERLRRPDRTFKPEAYTFAEGGCLTRPVRDAAMEEMTFRRVAAAVATPLTRLNYRPARNSAKAELLIMVFWGATEGSRGRRGPDSMGMLASAQSTYNATVDPADRPSGGGAAASGGRTANDAAAAELENALWMMALDNEARDKLDNYNARVLGYSESLERARFVRHMSFAQDVLSEIAGNRYYVVLQAYDFKTAREQRKLKPLWTARLSMAEAGDFAGALGHMLRHGAKYFGQDTKGLRRDVTHEGTVELGPTEILGTVPDK